MDCTDGLDVWEVLGKTVLPAPPAPLSGNNGWSSQGIPMTSPKVAKRFEINHGLCTPVLANDSLSFHTGMGAPALVIKAEDGAVLPQKALRQDVPIGDPREKTQTHSSQDGVGPDHP